MTVFKNGSLARERIRDACGLDWNGFSDALRHTAPGNNGAMMLPWFEPEITPTVLTPGVRTTGLSEPPGPAHVRAVIEAQMMSMALHSRWMRVTPSDIRATGGAPGAIDTATEDPANRARITAEVGGLTTEMVVESIRGDWTGFYRNIADALLGRAALIVTPEQAVRAMGIVDAAMESSRTGETVRPSEATR